MRAIVHSHFTLNGNTLIDEHLGVMYTLSEDAAWLFSRFLGEGDLEVLAHTVSVDRNITLHEANQAIYSLLSDIGKRGAIVFVAGSWKDWLRKLAALRGWNARYAADGRGFCIALVRAYGLLVFGLELLFLAAWWQSGYDSFFLPLLLVPFLMVGSFALHEVGHVAVAKKYRVKMVFFARFGYFAVAYNSKQRAQCARNIAFAGPFLAAVTSVSFALLSASGVLAAVSWMLAAVHVIGMLPFTMDGREIWRSNKKH